MGLNQDLIDKRYQEYKAQQAAKAQEEAPIVAQRTALKEKYKLGVCRVTMVDHSCHICQRIIRKGTKNIKHRSAVETNPRTRRPMFAEYYFCQNCTPQEAQA